MAQNRFYSAVAVAARLVSAISSSATALVVTSTAGFPASFPYTLILERDSALEEVVTVTGGTGTTLTVVRGADSTPASAHDANVSAEHGVSARDYNEPQVHMAATSAVHGVTGIVVGTSDVQTLTNKTLTLGANTLTGTLTQLNTAITDHDLASLDGVETLSGKTLTNPTITNGSLTNTTMAGVGLDAASTIAGVTGTALAADRTAWTSYTPTVSGANGETVAAAYKKIGKTLFLRIRFSAGTGNASEALGATVVSLPAGETAAATQTWVGIGAANALVLYGITSGTTGVSFATVDTASLVGAGCTVAIETA